MEPIIKVIWGLGLMGRNNISLLCFPKNWFQVCHPNLYIPYFSNNNYWCQTKPLNLVRDKAPAGTKGQMGKSTRKKNQRKNWQKKGRKNKRINFLAGQHIMLPLHITSIWIMLKTQLNYLDKAVCSIPPTMLKDSEEKSRPIFDFRNCDNICYVNLLF